MLDEAFDIAVLDAPIIRKPYNIGQIARALARVRQGPLISV
jgi:hypothetical protein